MRVSITQISTVLLYDNYLINSFNISFHVYSPYLLIFRLYLNLIDLTKDSSSDSESSGDDESILPKISLTTSGNRSGLVVQPYKGLFQDLAQEGANT